MIVVDVNPVLVSVGPFTVRWYGLMYAVGITVGLLVAWPYARWRGIADAQLERIVGWSIPAGLVGARLYYVLQQPLGPYLREPWRILAFWEGGMAFFGAIFAFLIVVIALSRSMKFSVWPVLDVAAIFAVVGQFFGRIGNFINGDIIGYPTTLPWGTIYANPNSFPARHDVAYQPAAIYEALADVILFFLLWSLRKRVKSGMLFFLYIWGYAISQIVVFFWRDNQVVLLGLKQAQLTSIGVVALAAILFVWFRLRAWSSDDKRPAG